MCRLSGYQKDRFSDVFQEVNGQCVLRLSGYQKDRCSDAFQEVNDKYVGRLLPGVCGYCVVKY